MTLISNRYRNDGLSVVLLSELQQEKINQYNDKINRGEYSLRNKECECGHSDFKIIAEKDRYGIPSNTVICKNCGLIMTNPCLDDASNTSYYDNEYHYIYREEENPSDEKYLERKENAKDIIKFVKKHSRLTEGSVLEIGCADGGNVAAFCENGFKASGIDLSHKYIEYGKSKGLDLYCCDAVNFFKQDKQFDLIILNQVMEHFTDLRRELETIGKLLSAEGLLFVSVPGVKYLTYGAYYADFLQMLQSAHIYNFTETTLRNVMGINGFDCIFANEFIYGLFKKGTPVTHTANAYPDVMEYLRTVEAAEEDIPKLLLYRFRKILSKYGAGEVLLYGTDSELDALVQSVSDLSAIKGYFYSDKKSPNEIISYLRSHNKSDFPKCIIIADSMQNALLVESLGDVSNILGIDLYSVYCEIF